ncbi:MAG: type I glyceraldehyde-3-phosphate dehydrogenase [Planctomycetota bacterium]
MRIAVNGFGRIGRLFTRAAVAAGLDVVAIHEPDGTVEGLALGIEFDSVQGRWPHRVQSDDGVQADDVRGQLILDGRPVALVRAKRDSGDGGGGGGASQPDNFASLPWREHKIDLVVDCSGRAKRIERNQGHFDAGARAVLVSNPVPGVPNLVYGVNHKQAEWLQAPLFTAASCTTNCLAPIVRVLHDAIGIDRGLVTTLHDPTNTQVVADRPHRDPRRARSALANLIPTSTNSAHAVTEIVPELKGRLDSIAVRVPVQNASLTDCAFHMSRDTTVDEIQQVLREAADGRMRGILGFETRPLVSSDYAGEARSGVVDADCTRVVDKRLVKVMAWYDNEWGYCNRMVDLVRYRIEHGR